VAGVLRPQRTFPILNIIYFVSPSRAGTVAGKRVGWCGSLYICDTSLVRIAWYAGGVLWGIPYHIFFFFLFSFYFTFFFSLPAMGNFFFLVFGCMSGGL
jgi:hypothetical protein